MSFWMENLQDAMLHTIYNALFTYKKNSFKTVFICSEEWKGILENQQIKSKFRQMTDLRKIKDQHRISKWRISKKNSKIPFVLSRNIDLDTIQ